MSVLGFLFTPGGDMVALLKKTESEGQAASLDGIGGTIKPHETPHDAMRRSFQEKTGCDLQHWTQAAILEPRDHSGTVFIFAGRLGEHETALTFKQLTSERPAWYHRRFREVSGARPNLSWLIPLAWGAAHGETVDAELLIQSSGPEASKIY